MNKDKDNTLFEYLLILKRLQDSGTKSIRIEFSGSGDDGDIDDIEFFDDDYNNVLLNSHTIDAISNELRELAWVLISEKVDRVGDWINNEGGFGHIIIDVEKKTYNLNYNQRTTEDYDWYDEMLFT